MTRPTRLRQRGALLIEVLVAIILCAFALLGFAGLQARASGAEFESLQRSQALLLVQDMATRISANRAQAGDYVVDGLVGAGGLEDCAGLDLVDRDLCEWANLLRGASETRAGASVGAMLGARGCIVRAAGTSDGYVVSVAWQGMLASGAPAAPCGQGEDAFPDETARRVVTAAVCVASLRDPAAPPAVDRC
jgi:type IV pilus assembly protein PilV